MMGVRGRTSPQRPGPACECPGPCIKRTLRHGELLRVRPSNVVVPVDLGIELGPDGELLRHSTTGKPMSPECLVSKAEGSELRVASRLHLACWEGNIYSSILPLVARLLKLFYHTAVLPRMCVSCAK